MVIFPQPHKVERLDQVIVLAEDGDLKCRLVLAAGAEPLERNAA